jgi:hypothetical protein
LDIGEQRNASTPHFISGQEIERITTAVRQWCTDNNCEIDSNEGRRALTLAGAG